MRRCAAAPRRARAERNWSRPARAALQLPPRARPPHGRAARSPPPPRAAARPARRPAQTSYMRAVGEAQAAAPPEGMRLMSDDEREGMVRELKQKWDKINEDYQKSSTLSLASLDTIGKVKRCAPRARESARAPARRARAGRGRGWMPDADAPASAADGRCRLPPRRCWPRACAQEGAVRGAARTDREGHREAVQAGHLGARRLALTVSRAYRDAPSRH